MNVYRMIVEYRVWPDQGEPKPWKQVEIDDDLELCYNYDLDTLEGVAEAAVHQAMEFGHRHIPRLRGLNGEFYAVVEFRWLGQEPFKLRINATLIPNVHSRPWPPPTRS